MATISERLQYIMTMDVRQAVGAMDSFGKSADKSIETTDQKWDRLGTQATKYGAMAVAAAGVAGIGLFKMAQSASAVEESNNAVNVTFTDQAEAIHLVGETSAQSMGLSTAAFNQAAVGFSSFAQRVAGDGGNVAEVTTDMMIRASDFASVLDMDVGRAMDIFRSALAGETESIKRFGIDMSAASVEAFALANGITNTGEKMTETEKSIARYGLLMSNTEQMAGDFEATSDSLANSQRRLAADIENLKANIGAGLLPMFGALVGAASKVVGVFSSMSVENQKMVGSLAGGVTAIVGFAGVVLLAAGQLRKLQVALKKTPALASGMGAAMGVAAVALIAYTLHARIGTEETKQLQKALQDINEQSDADVIAGVGDAFAAAALKAGSFRSGVELMVKESPEAVARLLALESSGGGVSDALQGMGLSAVEAQELIFLMSAGVRDSGVAARESAAAAGELDGSLEGMASTGTTAAEVLAGIDAGQRLVLGSTEQSTAATDEAAEAWGQWADDTTEAFDAVEEGHADMVDAAEEWAQGVRDSVDSGAQSFLDMEQTSETTAREFIDDQNARTVAMNEHEGRLATVAGLVQTSLVDTGKVSQTEADGFMEDMIAKGESAEQFVKDLDGGVVTVEEAFNSHQAASKASSDGMLGAYDPVADGMTDRLQKAERAMGIQLAIAKYNAIIASREIGSAIPAGIAAGLQSGQGALNSAVRGLINNALAEARFAAETGSPSELFAREIGEPISEGIAQGIIESGQEIEDSLIDEIEDARDAALDAVEDLVEEVADKIDEVWDSIDDTDKMQDIRQAVTDALEDVAAAQKEVDEALAEFGKGSDEHKEALRKLDDAYEKWRDTLLKLVKATTDMITKSEESRDEWIEAALQAGLTKREVDKLVQSYLDLAAAQAEAGVAKTTINASATAAKKDNSYLTHWQQVVDADLVSGSELNSLSKLTGAALEAGIKAKLNQLSIFFGEAPRYAHGTRNHPGGLALVGEQGPEIVELPPASKVYPNGVGVMDAEIIAKAVTDGMRAGYRELRQNERAS